MSTEPCSRRSLVVDLKFYSVQVAFETVTLAQVATSWQRRNGNQPAAVGWLLCVYTPLVIEIGLLKRNWVFETLFAEVVERKCRESAEEATSWFI